MPTLRLEGVAAALHDGAAEHDDLDLSELYRLDESPLCRGSVGTVSKAWRRSDGRVVALKEVGCSLADEDEARYLTRREYEFMEMLSHPSIVRSFDLHETPSKIVVCMEYCDGGSLESYVCGHGALDSGAATTLAKQLLEGLDYLHTRRIVHRDVKPANLLLSRGAAAVKIGDFNSAKQIGSLPEAGGVMLTNRGTACYTAPEVHAQRMWNERVDLWSGGLSICFMLLGRLPFKAGSDSVRKALKRGRAPPMSLSELPWLMGNLARQCLAPDPCDRPPAVELLAHPAFGDCLPRGAVEAPERPEECGAAPVRGDHRGAPSRSEVDVVPACGLVWMSPGSAAAAARAPGRAVGPAASLKVRCARSWPGAGNDLPGVALWSIPREDLPCGWAVAKCSSEDPSPRCDKRPLWRGLAQRRFYRCMAASGARPAREAVAVLSVVPTVAVFDA